MPKTMTRFRQDERAATAIEYALLAGLIALVAIAGLGVAFNAISAKFNLISNTVSSSNS